MKFPKLFVTYFIIIILLIPDTVWALAPKLSLSDKHFAPRFGEIFLLFLASKNPGTSAMRFAEGLVRSSSSGLDEDSVDGATILTNAVQDRWAELSSKLDELEEAHRVGLSDKCGRPQGFSDGDANWYLAEAEVLKYMRLKISDPASRDIIAVEKLVNNISYLTGRRAYIWCALREDQKPPAERRAVADRRIVVLAPSADDNLRRLNDRRWRCDRKQFPDLPHGPEHFFNLEELPEDYDTVNAPIPPIQDIENEIASLAYHIDKDTLVIDNFLVNAQYRGKDIALWLFAYIVHRLYSAKEIRYVSFDYQASGARDMMASLPDNFLIGPYSSQEREYYEPGEYFTKIPSDITVKPRVLINISRDLLMALNPNIPFETAQRHIMNAINAISDAAGSRRINIYLPRADNTGEPVLSPEGENVWTSRSRKMMRHSRLTSKRGSALPGEKRVLEMTVKGKIPEDALRIPEVSEYDDGIWMIGDRKKLHEILKTNERLRLIIEEDEELLERDLAEYGSLADIDNNAGNSITYAYASDSEKKPLFLFAVIGPLTDTKVNVIRSGFLQARVAAERVRVLKALTEREIGPDNTNRKLVVLNMARRKIDGLLEDASGTPSDDIQNLSLKAKASMDRVMKQLETEQGESGEQTFVEPKEMPVGDIVVNIYYAMLTSNSVEQMREMVQRYQRVYGWKLFGLINLREINNVQQIAARYLKKTERFNRRTSRAFGAGRKTFDSAYDEFERDLERLLKAVNEPSLFDVDNAREDVGLTELVKDGVRLGIEKIGVLNTHGVSVEEEYPEEIYTVNTAPVILKETILSGLVKYAVSNNNYTGGSVKVAVSADAKAAFSRITITGGSFDELELYLAQATAEWLGGQLVLEESEPGPNSVFTLYLPLKGCDSVWNNLNGWNEYARGILDTKLAHAVGNLKQEILNEIDLLRRFRKDGHPNFEHEEELLTAYRNIEEAHAIAMRLSSELTNYNLSEAYFIDTLDRRVRPLLDMEHLKDLLDSLKEYYVREKAPEERIRDVAAIFSLKNLDEPDKDYIGIIKGVFDDFDEARRASTSGSPYSSIVSQDELPEIAATMHEALPTTALRSGAEVLLSEQLFDELDMAHLKNNLLSEKSSVRIARPDEILEKSKNNKTSRDKVAMVITRDEFEREWTKYHRRNNKATVIVLDNDLKGQRYLYIEGVVGFAMARMSRDVDRMRLYMNLIYSEPKLAQSDEAIDAKMLEQYLKDDDSIKFAEKIRLILKPIERFDTKEILIRYKIMVEGYLTAA